MKSYTYHFMDKDYSLGFFFDRYISTGNLYVGLINLGNEDDPYFCDLTINVTSLPLYNAAIDDSLDRSICKWLESIGAGKSCSQKMRSGFCSYPLFEFNPLFLREANSQSFSYLSK